LAGLAGIYKSIISKIWIPDRDIPAFGEVYHRADGDDISMNEATIDLAIGVRSETGEVVGFTTQKARVMYEHRASFLRKEKTVIVRRIQQSIASSMV